MNFERAHYLLHFNLPRQADRQMVMINVCLKKVDPNSTLYHIITARDHSLPRKSRVRLVELDFHGSTPENCNLIEYSARPCFPRPNIKFKLQRVNRIVKINISANPTSRQLDDHSDLSLSSFLCSTVINKCDLVLYYHSQ